MSSNHIPVRPFSNDSPIFNRRKLNNPKKEMDPDMQKVLEDSKKASKMSRPQTKEEVSKVEKSESGTSWVMIIFAIIIICLIIAIVWLVLKYNTKEDNSLEEFIMPPNRNVHFANPISQQYTPQVYNPPIKRTSRPPVIKENPKPEQESVEKEDESEEEQEENTEEKEDNSEEKEEVKMVLDSSSTLYDPDVGVAKESELFEILEGDNKRYEKKKREENSNLTDADKEENEMVSNYYNDVQDSDEEPYDE